MTLRFPILTAALAAFLFFGSGCANDKLTAERNSLAAQNKDLAEKLQSSEQSHQADQAKIDALSRQLAAAPAPSETLPPSMTGGPLELTGPVGRPATRTPSVTSAKPVTPVIAAPAKVKLPGEVLFDSGKTTLSAAATKTLDTMAATLLKTYKGDKIIIEGFTDSTPVKATATTLKSNDAIASARATAVMKYLAKKGVPEKNMSVKSMGDSEPKSTTNQALNRRVEVVVLK
jgi:outer membrane protein OmpA-like peptidoglycan-associated protein